MFGGGVVVFHNGTILGGDGTYFYTGRFTINENAFRATLTISPFIEGAESVFKTVGRNLTLELAGSVTQEGRAIAQGHPREIPTLNFGVKLTKRS